MEGGLDNARQGGKTLGTVVCGKKAATGGASKDGQFINFSGAPEPRKLSGWRCLIMAHVPTTYRIDVFGCPDNVPPMC